MTAGLRGRWNTYPVGPQYVIERALLCLSSGCGEGGRVGFWAWEIGVDFAGDVALQAADDLAFVEAFVGPSFDVGAGGFVVTHADDGDDVERAVGLSVSTTG